MNFENLKFEIWILNLIIEFEIWVWNGLFVFTNFDDLDEFWPLTLWIWNLKRNLNFEMVRNCYLQTSEPMQSDFNSLCFRFKGGLINCSHWWRDISRSGADNTPNLVMKGSFCETLQWIYVKLKRNRCTNQLLWVVAGHVGWGLMKSYTPQYYSRQIWSWWAPSVSDFWKKIAHFGRLILPLWDPKIQISARLAPGIIKIQRLFSPQGRRQKRPPK